MGIYRCLQAVAFDRPDGGGGSVITPDQVVSSDDPMFDGRQDLFENTDLFEPFPDFGDRQTAPAETRQSTVESATAAPGEKRSVGRPRKAAAGDDS